MIRAIVFDFDGVILESVDVKTQAFEELFRDYPEHVDAIVKLHLENGGMSRFEKFKIIYRDFLNLPLDEDESKRLGGSFSRLVFEKVLKSPFVPGAYEFLSKYSRVCDLFVASGTPEGELQDIVRLRDLDVFFRGVYGSPKSKSEILRNIMNENGVPPSEVVFIGDSNTDYAAASETAVHFVGRVAPGFPSPFPENEPAVRIDDLIHLDTLWVQCF